VTQFDLVDPARAGVHQRDADPDRHLADGRRHGLGRPGRIASLCAV